MRRRNLIGAIAVAAAWWIVAGTGFGQVPPGQVGYWPLDENGGIEAHDFQNGYNGTLFNSPTWTPGRFGSCLGFDKSDDYVQLPSGMLNSISGTISLWFKTPAIWEAVGSPYGMMFWAGQTSSGDGGGDQNELHLDMSSDTNHGRVHFFIEGGATDLSYRSASGTRYDDDVWHHAVVTWDRTIPSSSIYVDGASRASATTLGNSFTCNGVARLGYAWSGVRYYGGLLDEVRLFNRPLTAAEVTQLFNVTPEPARGTVARAISAPLLFTGASSVTVRLTATPMPGGGQIVVNETVPAGLTPSGITTSAGSAPFAAGVIQWTVTLGTVAETLTYQVTPTAGPTAAFTGTVNAAPSLTIPITGDNAVFGGLPIGQFDWHGNIGVAPLGAATGNPSLVGSATFASPQYTISGSGTDVAGTVDRCRLTGKLMTGNFMAEAVVNWVNAGPDIWAKAGIMVRQRMTGTSARAYVGIRNPTNVPGKEVLFEWRTNESAAAANGGEASWPTGFVAPAKVRLLRVGDMVAGYVWNTTTTQWVLVNPPRVIPDLTGTDVALDLFVTSHMDNGDAGATTNTVLATATFDNVTIQPVLPTLSAATRDILESVFLPGQPVTVTINLAKANDTTTLTVTETVPTSWTVSSISHGGTAVGGVVTWTLAPFTSATALLSYAVTPTDQAMPGIFSGSARDAQFLDYPITGETMLVSTAKRIIYIRNRNAGDYATHDGNIINALGDAGVRVGATTVPPLRYGVIEVQQDTDADTYLAADGDLIFVSQTCGSGNTKRHGDDPLPVVMTEQSNFDDGGGTQIDDMFFSDGAGALDENVFAITSTTHPITQIFPLGNLQIYDRISGIGQIGRMTTLGPGVMPLATRPTSSAQVTLAVMDQGATGLRPGAPGGFSPTPARRVCLGYHANSMTTPTAQGVYLLQRTIQWAMTEAVNAGEPAPDTPTGFRCSSSGATSNFLEWNDVQRESGYRLERKKGTTGAWVEIAIIPFDSTTYRDSSLTPGATHFYRLRAYNPTGNSAYTSEVEVAGVESARNWELYR
jgi:hypothetical protein